MTQKETNLRSVLFLVIGILLLLSLVICIYIVSGESDLVKTTALVTEVSKDSGGTGKTDISVTYDVDGQSYKYDYYHKGEVEEGDKVTLYYHEKNPSSVQTFKTNKLIFIWPVIGLGLCILGLLELFRKTDDEEDEFETSVIGIVGNTQQLKIVTDDAPVQTYQPTPEETHEVAVKAVKKEEPVPVQEPTPVVETNVERVEETKVEPVVEAKPEPVIPEHVSEPTPVVEANPEPAPVPVVAPAPVETVQNVEQQKAPSNTNSVEDALIQKVQNNVAGASAINEDEIKKVIKDVLKEVIQEVKEDKAPAEPVVQKRVLPNYYYISGTSLIYEEAGKEPQEIELKTVDSVVRTINSAGNIVKLVVSTPAVKCVLTNMKNIDLEQLASLLNNKMCTIDEGFKEEIEYKEY